MRSAAERSRRAVDFTLAFGKDVKGSVDVLVAALDASGATLASSEGKADITPSHSASVTITLDGGVVAADGGAGDLAVVPGDITSSSRPSRRTEPP